MVRRNKVHDRKSLIRFRTILLGTVTATITLITRGILLKDVTFIPTSLTNPTDFALSSYSERSGSDDISNKDVSSEHVEPNINTTVTHKTSKNMILSTNLLSIKFSTAFIWEEICIEGGNLARKRRQTTEDSSTPAPPVVAIEIGMHNFDQCFMAAKHDLTAHCVEPSPKNYQRVMKGQAWVKDNMSEHEAAAADSVLVYNMAAGSESGTTVPFFGNGGTGDHVGEFDAWNMVEGLDAEKDFPNRKKSKRTDVPMIKIDDLIDNKITPTNRKENDPSISKIHDVFALKVDTQGFEPAVFSGLKKSIEMKKIHYILFEYWPKGMDLLSKSDKKCAESVAILKRLSAAKYKLFALRVEGHPSSILSKQEMNDPINGRPYDNLETNCNWYYELEKRFPDANYKMGYWSDIFAVSPDAILSEPVTTSLGKKLMEHRM